MPNGISAFCNASRHGTVASPTASHIWISDDLLAHAFRSFANNHRRHGSNVPGPLEARRRAARRRATTLAHAPYPCNPHPAIIMQTSAQPRWWKNTIAATESFWSEFLGRPHQPPPVPVPFEDLEIAVPSWSLVQEQEFFANLNNIRAHRELILLLENLPTNPIVQDCRIGRRILGYMIEDAWERNEMEEFLLDPRTNPAGSSLFSCIFAPDDENSAAVIGLAYELLTQDVLVRAAGLGLLDKVDLDSILLFAMKQDAPDSFGTHRDMSAFIEDVLNALESSSVFDDKDYIYKMLMREFQAGRSSFWNPSTPRLMQRLITFTTESDESCIQTLTQTVNHCLNIVCRSNSHSRLHYLVDYISELPHLSVNNVLYVVTQHLTLPKQDAQVMLDGEIRKAELVLDKQGETVYGAAETGSVDALVLRALVATNADLDIPEITAYATGSDVHHHALTTQRMVASALSRSPGHDDMALHVNRRVTRIELWYAVLAGIGSRKGSQFFLDEACLTNFVAGKEGVIDPQRIILAFWIIMAVSVRVDRPLRRLFENNSILSLFSQYSDDCYVGNHDTLASILIQLQALPLPAKNKLLHRIDTLTGRRLGIKHDIWKLTCLYESIQKEGFSAFRDNMTYRRASRYFPTEVRKLSSSVSTELATFERSARSIIHETKGSVKVILRILAFHTDVKLALRHAADLMTWNGTNWETTKAADAEALDGYSYFELVKMIDTLAWDCAQSKQLSNRLALRFSWWLLMYLHMHRAPVLPFGALMAVWHVLIHRYDRPSYRVLQMVYSLMEEYLGEDAAQKMLNDSAHGHQQSHRPVQVFKVSKNYAPSLTHMDLKNGAQAGKPLIGSRS